MTRQLLKFLKIVAWKLFSEISDKFEKLKHEFLTSSYNKISEKLMPSGSDNSSYNKPTYTEILNDMQKIILKLKNPQSNNQTV